MKNKIQEFGFTPAQSTFGTLSTKYLTFFAFIKKIFLQTLVEIFFRYHKKYFKFLGSPGTTKKNKSENFTYGVLGIKIG